MVNIAAALVKLKWNGVGLSQEIWECIMLIIAVVLLIAVLLKIRNAVFPLPVAWAYFGIYQFLKSPTGFKGEFSTLQIISLLSMVVLIIVAVVQFYRNRFSILPETSKNV